MSGFSEGWLALREAADARAIATDVAEALAGRFALRDHVTVVDLGCGTGANLRRTSTLLPASQSWHLVDHDAGLLAAAQRALSRWADAADVSMTPAGAQTLHLVKGAARIDVTLHQRDIAGDLPAAFPAAVDLVTASALFDLTSQSFIRQLAGEVTARSATFYTTLTYNGVQRFAPHRPADNQMVAAFHRHQMRDKGFGPAAGPLAPAHLADQFRLHGYAVLEGDSPWHLQRTDRALIEQLIHGHAQAVTETGAVDTRTIETWLHVPRTSALIGHTDTLAVPSG